LCRLPFAVVGFSTMKESGATSITQVNGRSSFQLEEFYRRWKAQVFTFCFLFLGDRHLAGDATSRAFLSYYRQRRELELSQLPSPLISAALPVVYRLASLRSGPAVVTRAAGDARPLTDAILDLDGDERTVFILRTVLKMDPAPISAATGFALERVLELWRSALKMLSPAPANVHTEIQQPETADCKRDNQRQDRDGSAWTLKCGT